MSTTEWNDHLDVLSREAAKRFGGDPEDIKAGVKQFALEQGLVPSKDGRLRTPGTTNR